MLLDLFTNMVTFVQGDSEIHDTSYFDIHHTWGHLKAIVFFVV